MSRKSKRTREDPSGLEGRIYGKGKTKKTRRREKMNF